MKISQSEWEKELEKYYGRSLADGFTSDEMGRALGITNSAASVKITQNIRDGKVRFAGYKDTVTVLGTHIKRPCYQFVKDATNAKPVGHVVRQRGGR